MSQAAHQNLLLEFPGDGVALVRLNRPKVLNSLNRELMKELVSVLQRLDGDEGVACIVLTGDEGAFAAGADVQEMAQLEAMDIVSDGMLERWQAISEISKPLLAAVSGYALGGGCELALACDIIIASETARFGQPEINLGVLPGAGGAQRIARAAGRSRAMELILTGRHFSAAEAEAMGLVSRVVPVEGYLDEALALAREIAAGPPLAVRMAKKAVRRAEETSLAQGTALEQQMFYLAFASEDRKEGMQAFLEKRSPRWQGR